MLTQVDNITCQFISNVPNQRYFKDLDIFLVEFFAKCFKYVIVLNRIIRITYHVKEKCTFKKNVQFKCLILLALYTRILS